jgi:WD40 repeat protein
VSVDFSPDGKTLATGDGQITLWDLSRRTVTQRMNAHGDQIRSVAFSPDGHTIASAAQDRVVLTWEVKPQSQRSTADPLAINWHNVLNRYRGHTNAVWNLAFSPRGDRLASAGKDGAIQIWDPKKPQDRHPLHTAPGAFGLAISPDGNTLAAVLQGRRRSDLLIWRSLSDLSAVSIPFEEKQVSVNGLTFSSDGKTLACLMRDGLIFFYDDLFAKTRTLAAPNNLGFLSCAFSPDTNQLAVAATDWNTAQVLDAATGEVLSKVPGQRSVAFSPDGRLLATESSDVREFYPIELWDIAAGRSLGHLVGHKGQIDRIVFSSDGRLLATASGDGTARLWDMENQTESFTLRGHERGLVNVAFLLGNNSVATAGVDGKVKIWQVATGRELLSLNVTPAFVSGLVVSSDGRTLITAGSNSDSTSRIDLWHAPAEAIEN